MKKVSTTISASVKFLTGTLLISCLTPIDLRVDSSDESNKVVIGGQISTIADRNYVEVGITSAQGRLPDPVSGAIVLLKDNVGNIFEYVENFNKPGLYTLPQINGISGREYQIEVKLASGKIYKSEVEVMPVSVGTDFITSEYVLEKYIDSEGAFVSETFLKIYTAPSFPDNKPYLCRWLVEEVYQISPVDFPDPFGYTPPDCFVTQNADPQKSVFFDGREYSTPSNLKIQIANRQVDQTFHYKHYFTVYQSAITPKSLDYWSKVNVLANQTGSIFDTPPAEISGNISNPNSPEEKVYGFFQATAQTMERFYTLRVDLPQFAWLPPYCEYQPGMEDTRDYPPPCGDCLTVRNSSYERPDWF